MGIARKCSFCGNLGHNARTCKSSLRLSQGQLKLFGVQLHVSSSYSAINTSFSTDFLFSSSPSPPSLLHTNQNSDTFLLSADTLVSTIPHTNKGVPWTEEEHRIFLIGLETLGKGNWRGISKRFVTTRTPTQVASHAQKYFLRQSQNRKHRRSLFHWFAHPRSVLNWSTPSTLTNCTVQSEAPDLELKLATPKPLELTEAFPTGLLR
ncbi:hypothetical protein VNO78_00677 [Psophocarpus tetragonolobus]|uniref:MYB transcription factor n=1 Tax=Psophocarpus tetragonolobus TaxID=3891 RepID=A0AAN9SXC8_PSOTE